MPVIAARNVPSSMTPFPHDSRFSGRISGNNPYFEGPKRAPCVLARKSAASDMDMLRSAKPAMANNMTAISNSLVPTVTVRLL